MPTRNVVLSDAQERLIHSLVEKGSYQNASEVIREGMRLVERRERAENARIEGLRQAIAVGEAEEAQGDLTAYDAAMLDEIDADLDRS